MRAASGRIHACPSITTVGPSETDHLGHCKGPTFSVLSGKAAPGEYHRGHAGCGQSHPNRGAAVLRANPNNATIFYPRLTRFGLTNLARPEVNSPGFEANVPKTGVKKITGITRP